ncbi:Uncharacterised protein [Segatella copri]|nr:Uncharacterised protein [Segatella copri]
MTRTSHSGLQMISIVANTVHTQLYASHRNIYNMWKPK